MSERYDSIGVSVWRARNRVAEGRPERSRSWSRQEAYDASSVVDRGRGRDWAPEGDRAAMLAVFLTGGVTHVDSTLVGI